jgi:hypothetical protein
MMGADIAFAGETTTTVTTYVVRTQEEREQTKWSITEWLRIKERMKLMDVWLAVLSDPKKDQFRPELNVSVLATRSNMERKVDKALTDEGTGQGKTARAQVFLTNLISSKIGIRTLNLDLGFEAGGRDSGILAPKAIENSTAALIPSTNPASTPYSKTNWYTLDMRIFGKHIQDSSLVLKYGLMNCDNTLQLSNATIPTDTSKSSQPMLASGVTAGLELQIYLSKNIGVEGTAHQYRANRVAYQNHTLSGTYGEGLGFIEIGILRLQGGIYEERWLAKWQLQEINSLERGYVGGLKLLL